MKYPAYCPSHLTVHTREWCTTGNHIYLDTDDEILALMEARRRGYCFYHGDVVNLRDSSIEPKVGDNVILRRQPHLVRQVVFVGDGRVEWKRPGTEQIFSMKRASWRRWSRGCYRCTPEGYEVGSGEGYGQIRRPWARRRA